MAEFLLELFSEEIPARMQVRAAEDLRSIVCRALDDAGLTYDHAVAHSTLRRLALVIDGLPLATPDRREERRGPRVGAPEKAVAGFLRGAGLSSLDQCIQQETSKGTFWFAVVETKGQPTRDVLTQAIAAAINTLPWPKSMRWATGTRRWVRPLHSIIAVFDGAVLEGQAVFGGDEAPVPFSNTTYGHRFLSSGAISVSDFHDYKARLADAYVMLDRADRRAVIADQATTLAGAEGLTLIDDPGLLEEVVGLVEWPVVLMGGFDKAFLDVPPEVLTTTMRLNQKYFALQDATGALANRFVLVANMVAGDGGTQIVRGNERVLRARLADAQFFWEQDRKTPLEDRVPSLGEVTFHAKLGSMADKVQRLQALSAEIVPFVPGADVDRARSAALLAKADLVSGMVGEFPELQGLMGRYYALAEGEASEVADAVAEHYKPLGPADTCPTAPLSIVVALADKIDTLVGFFAIDEKPTGSKDPFALRRAALGVIRLIVENKLRLPLGSLFESAHRLSLAAALQPSRELATDLLGFFADRLKVVLRDHGVRHDLIDAVFFLGGEDDLTRLLARVHALQSFLSTEDGENLLVAYRRASNIVRIEERKDNVVYRGASDRGLMEADEEIVLADALDRANALAGPALAKEDFEGAMAALAAVRGPVDGFFERVTVNVDDPPRRANRLHLLSEIRATLDRVASFERIEG